MKAVKARTPLVRVEEFFHGYTVGTSFGKTDAVSNELGTAAGRERGRESPHNHGQHWPLVARTLKRVSTEPSLTIREKSAPIAITISDCLTIDAM